MLLKKKPLNVRASMTQSQLIDKAVANLRRVTQENQRKIVNLEEQAFNLENIIYKMIEERSNKRKKKQKDQRRVFNFQDFDQEDVNPQEKSETIINSHAHQYQFANSRCELKPIIIPLNAANQTPKIVLLPFESKTTPPVQAKQPAPKKIEVPASKPVPQANSFIDKIPPKKEKVVVPVIPKIEEKKEEQKQAISEGISDVSEPQMELPTARRQISSIQATQVKGLKLPTAAQGEKKAPEIAVKPPAQAKKNEKANQPSLFGKKTDLQPPKVEENMLFSQTTSLFSSTKAAPGAPNASLFGNKKPEQAGQKKPTEVKPPTTSLFASSSSQSLFSQPKPPATQSKDKSTKEDPVKTVVKKQEQGQKEKDGKSSGFSFGQSSGTASLFSLNPGAPSLGGGSLFNPPKKSETQQKSQNQKKPEGQQEAKKGALGSLFGKLTIDKKQDEVKSNTENKSVPSIFAPATTDAKTQPKPTQNKAASPLGSLFSGIPSSNPLGGGGSLFGDKKADPSVPPTEKKPENAPKQPETKSDKSQGSLSNPNITAPVANSTIPTVPQPATTSKGNPIVTDEVAQSSKANNANPATSVSPNQNLFNNPSTQQQQPASVFGSQPSIAGGNLFAGGSPAPQFGVGNNKFMNTATTQPKSTGFDPNAAKFGFNSNNQKSFANVASSDGSIFQQQQPQNSASNNPFTANMFNQAQNSNPLVSPSFNNVAPSFNASQQNNSIGNNQGNMFNPTGNNSFMSNSFGNNTQNTNPFNNMSSNNNTNNFGLGNNNNNPFNNQNPPTNTIFNGNQGNMFSGNSMLGGNTNNNSMFNNTGNPSSMFGNNNNNNNQNTNFLNQMNTGQMAPPPAAMNSHLMQMRK